MFGVAMFVIVAIGVAVAIAVTGNKKPASSAPPAEALTVLMPKVFDEVQKAPEAPVAADLGARVSVKRSSMWLEDTDIPEPFVHTEKGHTFQEYAETLESGRETFQAEKPDGPRANLDYLKQDLKKKGLGLQDFVDSFGVSVPDAFVDSWTSTNASSPKRAENKLKSSSDMTESEMRQLAQEASQIVPTSGPMASAEAVTAVLREILAARTEASQIGLNLGPMDPVQRQAIETIATGTSKAATLAKTILSRI
jgi:hypothetical protein